MRFFRRLVVFGGLAIAIVIAFVAASEAATLPGVKKLTASDASAGDYFGHSVAVSGDIIVVGARLEDTGGLSNAGAAYVLRRDQGGAENWGEVKKLVASDFEATDYFGDSVTVSGDTAVVGAVEEDTAGSDAGAAYVFHRDQGGAGNWGEVRKLLASDAQAGDRFGGGVSVSGDTAVVGARREDPGGNNNAGAAYVFERNQGGPDDWGEVKKLTASDGQAGDEFGNSVAISGDTAVVGAYQEDAGGGVLDEFGAAYVFQRDEGGPNNWGEVAKLTASDAAALDLFGWSVAVSADTAVVGARLADHPEGNTDAGAAYVFRRDQGGAANWGEVAKLLASDDYSNDQFGWSVAVSGDTAVVGAPLVEDGPYTESGAAYVFQRRGEACSCNWDQLKRVRASDPEARDRFGNSAAISGDTVLVGARREDSGGTDAGAAYLVQLPPRPVGGIAVEPDLSALAADTAAASGGTSGIAAAVAIAAAAALVAGLVGTAWYARRRS